MTSVIYFRKQVAKKKDMEEVQFPGHQIRVLDLKRLIMDKKQLKASFANSDFDLTILDADDPKKEFNDDYAYIPKNSRVQYKQIPKDKGFGLSSRFAKSE